MRPEVRFAAQEGHTGSADIDHEKAGQAEKTGGFGTGTPGSSNVAGQNELDDAREERGEEQVEEYGSRTDG